ncbi:MAG: hypothetical protein H8D87_09765 [Deltaproteobacteria bacterium]|uniref:hypothetical protein n=1 Tax=Desulfobacula sp. TaxID=2593537 RepID=UPI0019A1F164|nr:hypothetical protein [Candidatus Desulfobacula maris]MBL6992659.1 hypothetical protein [Desulfobacula sp.]
MVQSKSAHHQKLCVKIFNYLKKLRKSTSSLDVHETDFMNISKSPQAGVKAEELYEF